MKGENLITFLCLEGCGYCIMTAVFVIDYIYSLKI